MSGRPKNRSQTALNWVREHSHAKGNDRFVLLIFAFYVHRDTGLTYPSVLTIMRETGLGRSKVFEAIKNLEDLGELKKVQRRFNSSSQYEIIGPFHQEEKSTGVDFTQGREVQDLDREVHGSGLLKSTGATATTKTTTTKTTTTTRDSRFESAVSRAARHRASLSWVENPIAVKIQTARNLRDAGDEGDALNDWLIENPDATADEAGLAYAQNQIPNTESFIDAPEVAKVGRTYRYEDNGPEAVPQFRIWSDSEVRWTREEYAETRSYGKWSRTFDVDPYQPSWNEELDKFTEACDCMGGRVKGCDPGCGNCGGKGWLVAAQ